MSRRRLGHGGVFGFRCSRLYHRPSYQHRWRIRNLMKTRIMLATAFVALSAAHSASGGDKNSEGKAVNAAFDRYVLGWQKGDIDLLQTVYAHDARLTAYWPDPTRPMRLESW